MKRISRFLRRNAPDRLYPDKALMSVLSNLDWRHIHASAPNLGVSWHSVVCMTRLWCCLCGEWLGRTEQIALEKQLSELQQQRARLSDAQQTSLRHSQELKRLQQRQEQLSEQLARAETLRSQQLAAESQRKLTMERAEQIVEESKQWALPLFGKETATRMASEAIAKSRG